MKADLYTAEARTAGSHGLAHRTAAGFVVLTSADGDDLIALIDAKQNESDLIDQVVAKAQADAPAAFAMLFTAGGDLYVIACGVVVASIASATMNLTVSASPGNVLVHRLTAGISETAANIRLRVGEIPDDAVTHLDLKSGTVEADWVEVAIGGATIARSTESLSEPAVEPVAIMAPEPPSAIPEPPTPPPAAIPEPPTPPPAAIPEPPTPPPAAIPEPPTPPPAAIPEPPTPPPAAIPEPPTPPPAAIPEPPTPPPAPAAAPETAPTPAAAAPAEVAASPEPAESNHAGHVGPVMVLGISCSQGHHNHPDAVYCSQCGTKMGVHHTTVLMNGPRPPLGVLVVDDGTTYSLSNDLVIGREPTSHGDVLAGTATPMILTDDTLSLSRQHARIVLEDWSVSVRDLNSSNGTFLSRAGQAESWTQLASGSSSALEPGDRLRVGGRIIQVELHHVR